MEGICLCAGCGVQASPRVESSSASVKGLLELTDGSG